MELAQKYQIDLSIYHSMCFNYKKQGKMLPLRTFSALENVKLVILSYDTCIKPIVQNKAPQFEMST